MSAAGHKKNSKRPLAVLAACLLVLGLAACGQAAPESADVPTSAPASTPVAQTAPDAAPPTGVIIAEVMAGNDAGLTDCDGELSDWIELFNAGDTAAELSLCWLSDSADEPLSWRFPAGTTLAPGARLVVFASGKDKSAENGELHTSFKLSRAGEAVVLSAADGALCDRVSWEGEVHGRSLCRAPDGALIPCATPTPGAENTFAAYLALCENEAPRAAVCISEVVTDNVDFPAPDGGYYDWVELYNASDTPAELRDYRLSDSRAESCALPELLLAPGEYLVVFCDADAQAADFPLLPFSLAFEGEGVYLSRADGALCDSCWVEARSGHSLGRRTGEGGFFYFDAPTPCAPNGAGARAYTAAPLADADPGLYNDVSSLPVALTGEGEIRYTLDGSEPDKNAALYTAPLSLTQSCVLRARAYQDGLLPSDTASFSYLLNENDTLAVISLAVDPEEFLGDDGIYYGSDKTLEAAGSVAYFAADGSFTHECGLTLHGNSEMDTRAQKGLQINFGNDFGGDLDFAVFGADGQSSYHSLMLRSGISREYYFLADVLYTSLFARCTDATEYLRWRFVSVYINGEYWGMYQLREHYSLGNLAIRWEAPKESIDVVRATEMDGTEIRELLRWARSVSLSEPANYARLASQLDLENFAEWMIIQAYSGNNDHRTNVKWVRSAQYDGKWHILLYDIDRPMILQSGMDSLSGSTAELVPSLVRALSQSEEFRTLLIAKLAAMLPTLTTENTLQTLTELRGGAESELRRSLTRWGYSVDRYERGIARLETLLRTSDMPAVMVSSAAELLGMSESELRAALG